MENALGSGIIDVHHLVLVQEFHLRQHNMVARGLARKSWPRFREKAHKEAESYSIVASWGDCLLWTLNFHSAASATAGHLAKSIKAAGQKWGGGFCMGQTAARLAAARRFDPNTLQPISNYCPAGTLSLGGSDVLPSPPPLLEMKHQREFRHIPPPACPLISPLLLPLLPLCYCSQILNRLHYRSSADNNNGAKI